MVIVHQHDGRILEPLVRAEVEILLLTGKAMDFATRLRGHGTIVTLTHELILRYAAYAGIGQHELVATVLPAGTRRAARCRAIDRGPTSEPRVRYPSVRGAHPHASGPQGACPSGAQRGTQR